MRSLCNFILDILVILFPSRIRFVRFGKESPLKSSSPLSSLLETLRYSTDCKLTKDLIILPDKDKCFKPLKSSKHLMDPKWLESTFKNSKLGKSSSKIAVLSSKWFLEMSNFVKDEFNPCKSLKSLSSRLTSLKDGRTLLKPATESSL
ncbi:hypothetical protein WICPIJ_010098 [Wickerhamomyces pijperi]|uniref:Uncharacterized protein n=1 Tax=Wickerhamomyces pijperi TaxID=599730 RepID=A0A9P8PJ34_WICPI|nr:hypothetical protein WICPIJ_010098 [Wickerhamomyces pijperi]